MSINLLEHNISSNNVEIEVCHHFTEESQSFFVFETHPTDIHSNFFTFCPKTILTEHVWEGEEKAIEYEIRMKKISFWKRLCHLQQWTILRCKDENINTPK